MNPISSIGGSSIHEGPSALTEPKEVLIALAAVEATSAAMSDSLAAIGSFDVSA